MYKMEDFFEATYEDLDDDKLERLNRFRNLSIEKLKLIKPLWVNEETQEKAQLINFNDYTIIVVSTELLIQKAHLLGLKTETIFNNQINDFRYITTLEMWENKEYVDPPTIFIKNFETQTISISDGRHRTILANYLGQKTIPIVVPKYDVDKISEILKE